MGGRSERSRSAQGNGTGCGEGVAGGRFARGQRFVATATAVARQLGVACGVEQVLVPGATHSNALMSADALQAILTRLPRASL